MDITIAQTVSARLITLDEHDLVVSATLRYAAADPLAVHVDFPPEASVDGDDVSWTFARSLLEEGLARPAGTGNVRLRPCGDARTVLELHAPSGRALLQFDTPALRRFLLRTHAVVAPGREDVGAAVERGLDALFGTV